MKSNISTLTFPWGLSLQKTALGSVIPMHLEVLSSFEVQVPMSAWVVTWHAQSLTLAE